MMDYSSFFFPRLLQLRKAHLRGVFDGNLNTAFKEWMSEKYPEIDARTLSWTDGINTMETHLGVPIDKWHKGHTLASTGMELLPSKKQSQYLEAVSKISQLQALEAQAQRTMQQLKISMVCELLTRSVETFDQGVQERMGTFVMELRNSSLDPLVFLTHLAYDEYQTLAPFKNEKPSSQWQGNALATSTVRNLATLALLEYQKTLFKNNEIVDKNSLNVPLNNFSL